MQTQITDEVLVRVDALASKLGVAVEHLWEVFTVQSVISGWSSLAVHSVAALVSLTVVIVILRRRMNGHPLVDSNEAPTVSGIILWPTLLVAFITIARTVIGTSGWVTKILNPEYAAWKEIQKLL